MVRDRMSVTCTINH